MEDDLLYGDIDRAGKDTEIEQLKETINKVQVQNDALTAENLQLKEQISCLVADKTQLEANIVSLYDTAKRELKRKDVANAELRSAKNRPA
mmetsp:Transcript_15963/g.26887  ORF Transcript_15963/g.26887 Transcript_15963/m.26887 type:complete len:91 (+) Transcript_15963:167-439(+)